MAGGPDDLKKVTLKLKANVYFDGGVISHTAVSEDGSKKTLGLIRPGAYHFNTDAPERMDIVAGTCRVKFANDKNWKTFQAGEAFNVPGKSSFDIAVDDGLAEYLCTFC
jgi:uncharacterized protein YaiE (UPF0345 family)